MNTKRATSLLLLVLAAFVFTFSLAVTAQAQTLTTPVNLNKQRGVAPVSPLTQSIGGDLFGTAILDGASSQGTAFRIDPAGGAFAVLYNYCPSGNSPCDPEGGLIQAPNGNFFGTSTYGGSAGQGTVYELTPQGRETTLYSFTGGTDEALPFSTLLLASDGNFYGTTSPLGLNPGTVFKITPSGTLTTLHAFDGTDGSDPLGALIEHNGEFYGTTWEGGTAGYGTVFKITPSGTLTTLHSFSGGADGFELFAGLTLGSDGNFYGTTNQGGANGDGTFFKITPSGTLTTLHDFVDSTDGTYVASALIQANDGNFYGTAQEGGTNPLCTKNGGCGTIFEITPAGVCTTLHVFDGSDGENPSNGLLQATDGSFYGATRYGGSANEGTIFAFNTGLPAFVLPRPAIGRVGASIAILGNGLSGATAVTFNGTPATFTVVSDTAIKATVPTGATTGTIQVTTSGGGALNSNPAFQVIP